MVKFHFKKISQVPPNFFRKRKEICDYLKEIEKILKEKNYHFPEGFLILPQEKFFLDKKFSKNLKLIIVVGIGGSSLGAKAIFEALKANRKLVETLFLDALNPFFLRKVEAKFKLGYLKKNQSLIFFISKSGKNLETIANFFALLKIVKNFSPKIFVITTKNSPLWVFKKEKNYSFLEVPKEVEGRYSVFSNVGLYPLGLAGVKVEELLLGAKMANELCLKENPLESPALASCLTIFYHWQRGKQIYSNFVFPPDLEYFGKWYVQLMAESLGKEGKGITPIVNIGTTDFHSIGQLFFDGPRDKLINFVFVENLGLDYSIPKEKYLDFFPPGIANLKIWQLNKIIFEGAKRAYLKKKLPFTETILERLDERNLGFLMEMKMIEILFLAKLMKVEAFGQPAVELYKAESRRIIQSQS